MKRAAEWFGEFAGEAKHQPVALFGKPGCLIGVKRLGKVSSFLVTCPHSHTSACVCEFYDSSVRSSRLKSFSALSRRVWHVAGARAAGVQRKQWSRTQLCRRIVHVKPNPASLGWIPGPSRSREGTSPETQLFGDPWLVLEPPALCSPLCGLRCGSPRHLTSAAVVENNQSGKKPSDTWRSRRTRVYFMPVDPDEITLEILGPG